MIKLFESHKETESKIFRRSCINTKNYKGRKKPTCGCQACWDIYEHVLVEKLSTIIDDTELQDQVTRD